MEQNLYMTLLGCKPRMRLTEQHDMFFGVGNSLKSLVLKMKKFWPDGVNLHIDAWRMVRYVEGFKIIILENPPVENTDLSLFFINLGGYEKGHFEEQHHKMLLVAESAAEAVIKAKSVAFFKTKSFTGALSHIDDKYEVDDIINVKEILAFEKFYLHFEKVSERNYQEDEIHLGYFKLDKLKD